MVLTPTPSLKSDISTSNTRNDVESASYYVGVYVSTDLEGAGYYVTTYVSTDLESAGYYVGPNIITDVKNTFSSRC